MAAETMMLPVGIIETSHLSNAAMSGEPSTSMAVTAP
jgi:hypothetical protein